MNHCIDCCVDFTIIYIYERPHQTTEVHIQLTFYRFKFVYVFNNNTMTYLPFQKQKNLLLTNLPVENILSRRLILRVIILLYILVQFGRKRATKRLQNLYNQIV